MSHLTPTLSMLLLICLLPGVSFGAQENLGKVADNFNKISYTNDMTDQVRHIAITGDVSVDNYVLEIQPTTLTRKNKEEKLMLYIRMVKADSTITKAPVNLRIDKEAMVSVPGFPNKTATAVTIIIDQPVIKQMLTGTRLKLQLPRSDDEQIVDFSLAGFAETYAWLLESREAPAAPAAPFEPFTLQAKDGSGSIRFTHRDGVLYGVVIRNQDILSNQGVTVRVDEGQEIDLQARKRDQKYEGNSLHLTFRWELRNQMMAGKELTIKVVSEIRGRKYMKFDITGATWPK